MFCPKCSQQQSSDDARFCSRCGFPLEGVTQLLAAGGQFSAHGLPQGKKPPASPRLKGVQQGAKIMLSGILIVPLIAILQEEFRFDDVFTALAAVICFVGGFLRLLFALLFQDGPLRRRRPQTGQAPPLFAPANPPVGGLWAPQRDAEQLPPAQPAAVNAFARPQRLDTSEIYQPPSVVDHTTRLLKDEPGRQA
jgi:hypothetical protein